jgi:hypothetical protein
VGGRVAVEEEVEEEEAEEEEEGEEEAPPEPEEGKDGVPQRHALDRQEDLRAARERLHGELRRSSVWRLRVAGGVMPDLERRAAEVERRKQERKKSAAEKLGEARIQFAASLGQSHPNGSAREPRYDSTEVAREQELTGFMRAVPTWNIMVVGFNSQRFDLPLLLAHHTFSGVTNVNQGSDSRVKSIVVAGCRHLDVSLVLGGGSLASNSESFPHARDAEDGADVLSKWYTPFTLLNSYPPELTDTSDPEGVPLADRCVATPTWAEWRMGKRDDEVSAEMRASFATIGRVHRPTLEEWLVNSSASERARLTSSWEALDACAADESPRWLVFRWLTAYCDMDCRLLARLTRNLMIRIAEQSGVVVLLETATMASTSLKANRRAAGWNDEAMQCNFSPFAERLFRSGFFGGVNAGFARSLEASGGRAGAPVGSYPVRTAVALDVVSAYPSKAVKPRPGELPYGRHTAVYNMIGNGMLPHRLARLSPTERATALARSRALMQPNVAGRAKLMEYATDVNSTVFGWARVAVWVYLTHPRSGVRTAIGPIPVRTGSGAKREGLVTYPVGVFYATATLATLRDLVRTESGKVLRVYEGVYCQAPPPEGVKVFPHTAQALLQKVLASGWPAPARSAAQRARYVERLQEYFAVPVSAEAIVKDKRLATVYKLFINAAWGVLVTKPQDRVVVLDPTLAVHLNSAISMSVHNFVEHVEIPFTAARRALLTSAPDYVHGTATERAILVGINSPVKARFSAIEGMGHLASTPAVSTGAAVPAAMRGNLIRFVNALRMLGCVLAYSDTDSIKFYLPPGCDWPTLRGRFDRLREHPEAWVRWLVDGVGIGAIPGEWALEGVFDDFACFRSKGLSMTGYVDAHVARAACEPVCTRKRPEAEDPDEPCLACPECVRARRAVGEAKTVISGVRPGDPEGPTHETIQRLTNQPQLAAAGELPPSFMVSNQLSFRVSTGVSTSDAATHAGVCYSGSIPSGMQMVVGRRVFVASKPLGRAELGEQLAEVNRLFTPREANARTDEDLLTWPPIVHMRGSDTYKVENYFRPNGSVYVFCDHDTAYDVAVFTLPDDAHFECPEAGAERLAAEIAVRDRAVAAGGWEYVEQVDEFGLARLV